MPPSGQASLWDSLNVGTHTAARAFHGLQHSVDLHALRERSALRGDREALRGRSVLLYASDSLCAAVALIELDGLVKRMVLCPPGTAIEHLPAIAAQGELDAVVGAAGDEAPGLAHLEHFVIAPEALEQPRQHAPVAQPTEWVLMTSGTSGAPKLVLHSLASLAGAIANTGPLAGPLVWSTFYDIRRYGGLQIYLRAVIGGGSLVLSDSRESIDAFLARAAACGVTHLTGTPSHWRRALMSSAAHAIAPRYARMSGEIADQAIIDRLRAAYPGARVAHAFASTEAGVGFEVDDGLAGFPAAFLERRDAPVEIRVEDDTLRLRSTRTATRYLGSDANALRAPDAFVDTGDVVELREGRYFFVGRRGGTINVGGLKVHPEEVEAVINRHPRVRQSLVKARKNPITGSLVVAEIVPLDMPEGAAPGSNPASEQLKSEVLELCRGALAPYKVPALIRIVAGIDVTASGKLTRVYA